MTTTGSHPRRAPSAHLSARPARPFTTPERGAWPLRAEPGEVRAVRRRDRVYRTAVLGADLAATVLIVALSLAWTPTRQLSWTALILLVVVPIVHWANGLYERDARVLNKSTLEEGPVLFRASTAITMVTYLLQSAVLVEPIGAKVVGFTWLSLTVLVPASRVAARAAVRRALPPERCLLLGDSDHGRYLAAKLGGAVGVKSELVANLPLAAAANQPARLADTVRRLDIHRVVIVSDESSAPDELEAIRAAKALGVKVSVLPRVLEVVGSSASYDFVDGLTFLGVPRFGLSPTAQFAKRSFDLVGSLLGLLAAAPCMLAITIAIKLTSPGPVFFRQTRIGRHGRAFSMLKFRSMQADADRLKDQLRDRNEQVGLFKIADDPRVTGVGRFLRRTSFDELPQLLNVVRGEMSLVGPRPLVPEEDRQIQGWSRWRLHLTPGMTGPWQVLGSSRIPLDEMVTIDYLYVANWSVWNDVKVMLRTVGAVFGRRGC